MEKMTDNEIIKALECCNVNGCCDEECPYCTKEFKGKVDCLDMNEGIMAKALDLINRQKAELKQKDTEIDILIRKKERLKDEVSEMRAEVERLQGYMKGGAE